MLIKHDDKPINFTFPIIILIFFALVTIYDKSTIEEEKINKQNTKTKNYETPIKDNIRKVGNEFVQYNVTQNDEIKRIAEIITRHCKGDETCEIDHIFKYVTDKPYVLGSTAVKTPNQVINQNGGDCDEKTYLFASMLKEKNHKCVIVYTKDHAFATVYLKDRSNLYPHTASLEINGKYYFYAETTAKRSYIGWFNKIKQENFKAIYDVNENKEIKLNEVRLNLN